MITTPEYYKGDIHIPNVVNASPAVNDLSNDSELNRFISQYEREVLIKLLGYNLYKEFSEQFDVDGDGQWTIKPASDQKWKDLLNGKEYTIDSVTYNFRGLIFSEGLGNSLINISLLSYYVFYNFLSNDVDTYSSVGVQSELAKNADRVSAIPRAVKAWDKFYQLSVGTYNTPMYITNASGMNGIDWFGCDDGERSLFEFINDINLETPDTYADWKPQRINNINQFGI